MAEKKSESIELEAAMKRLEGITEELSREGVSLEEALALYEEGVGLVRLCNKKLDETERRIKLLQISATGEVLEEDLDGAQ
jgi:exodeoxyribonuclease VII small subunit